MSCLDPFLWRAVGPFLGEVHHCGLTCVVPGSYGFDVPIFLVDCSDYPFFCLRSVLCPSGWGFQMAEYSYGSLLFSKGSAAIPRCNLTGYLELTSSIEDFTVSGQNDSQSVLLTRGVFDTYELLG